MSQSPEHHSPVDPVAARAEARRNMLEDIHRRKQAGTYQRPGYHPATADILPTEPPLPSPEQTEAPLASTESDNTDNIDGTALDLFSYADVIPGALGESTTPNARKYAHELVDMYQEVGGERLLGLANSMIQTTQALLSTVGVEGSPYSRSITWSLWDLAKQRYMSKHPATIAPEYRVRRLAAGGQVDNTSDPLHDTTKLWDIVDRHLGWEMQREMLEDRPPTDPAPAHTYQVSYSQPQQTELLYPGRFSEALQRNSHFDTIESLIQHGARNDTNVAGPNAATHIPALRSFELSRIGEQVRLAALEIQDGGQAKRAEAHQQDLLLDRRERWAEISAMPHKSEYDKLRTLETEAHAAHLQRQALLEALYNLTKWQDNSDASDIITTPYFSSTTIFNTALTHMLVNRAGGQHYGTYQYGSDDPFINLQTSFSRFENSSLGNTSSKSVITFHLERIGAISPRKR
jgi:hypothetical protein